jgi:hypothetical protein
MKQQFTLDSWDEVKRCKDFFRRGRPITVTGNDVLNGESRMFTGFVVSIESVSDQPTRITIETEDRRPK